MAEPTLHPDCERAAQVLREAGCQPAEPLKCSLQEAREQQDRHFAFLNADLPAVHAAHDILTRGPAGPLRLRVVHPHPPGHSPGGAPVVLFVRGAGWWAGGLHSHERTARLLATRTGAACVVLDYHRAPEHRFPTQLEELLAAIRWVRQEGAAHGLDGSRLVLWGESAGATTSLLAAQRMADTRIEPAQALVLFYGNFLGPGPTTRAQSRWVWEQLLGDQAASPPAAAIPVRQTMLGLPPVWLGCGEVDPLLEDTLAVRRQFVREGVTHQLHTWPGLPHGFMTLNLLLPAALEAVDLAWAGVAPWLQAAAR
jgi:acetyl esterase